LFGELHCIKVDVESNVEKIRLYDTSFEKDKRRIEQQDGKTQ